VRPHRRATRPFRWIVVGLAAANGLLLLWGLNVGGQQVRDGSGSVTTGYNVALAIGATLLAVLAIQALRLAAPLRSMIQVFALVAQALHSLGHLARWYYTYRWFDDALHVTLLIFVGVLALRLAQAWDIFPARDATRVRAALVALVAAIAIAGLWEIFEFAMDTLQGSREQDDLTDTMLDMIDGTIGGAVAAAWAAYRPRIVHRGRERKRHSPSQPPST